MRGHIRSNDLADVGPGPNSGPGPKCFFVVWGGAWGAGGSPGKFGHVAKFGTRPNIIFLRKVVPYNLPPT